MRINQFIARATGMSRRAADTVVQQERVHVNNHAAAAGQLVQDGDNVRLDNKPLTLPVSTTILLNKPVGYVCSRDGQGSRTIYDLLPPKLHTLKPVGRLDKDTSGLLLLTNDGNLANQLTHPSHQKQKIYQVWLRKPLRSEDQQQITQGIQLDDGLSKLQLIMKGTNAMDWTVTMHEGRNRQIRRTYEALGYNITSLQRTQFGPYSLGNTTPGKYIKIVVE